jgi:hypothetical protein
LNLNKKQNKKQEEEEEEATHFKQKKSIKFA